MKPKRLFIGLAICVAAVIAGAGVAVAMTGFGICGMDFSLGLMGTSLVIGVIFAALMAVLWPKVWWIGALLFSVTPLFGGLLDVALGEWLRAVGAGVCILATVMGSVVVRYPGPSAKKL